MRRTLLYLALFFVAGAASGAVGVAVYFGRHPNVQTVYQDRRVEVPVEKVVERVVTVHDTRTIVRTVHIDPVTHDTTTTTTVADQGTTNSHSDEHNTPPPCPVLTPPVVSPVHNWRVRALVASDLKLNLSYGAGVERRLFGPVFVGAQLDTSGRGAVTLGVEF